MIVLYLSVLEVPSLGWAKSVEPASGQTAVDACLSDPGCKKHVEEASALSKAGQFEAALTSYKSAYTLQQVAWLLVNIGRMQQKLGRVEEALNSYQQFLKTDYAQANPELRERVQGYLAEATEAASQSDACLNEPACKRDVDEATSFSKASQFEAALAAYKSAYARQPVAWLLVNIGRMQQKLGRHEESLDAYQRFLEADLGKTNLVLRVRVQGYLVEAQNTIAEQKKRTAAEQARLAAEQARLSTIESKLSIEQKRLAARTKPIYKRWWFWTILGSATAAATAAVAIGVTLNDYAREPDYISGLPEFRPFQ